MNQKMHDQDEIKSTTKTNCKHCNEPINLKRQKRLPKKLITERHGLYWTGLEKVFLLIFKVQCPKCQKKFSYKVFQSNYTYN
jgi:hypothetical protein